jgi:AcrR family transcriptional regulator
MPIRLSRLEQTGRNRERLLAAAREVFMARGYHGATLEQIAEAAGFSKGVVYSQFVSKADLFLSLLEARIEERAAQTARVVEGLAGRDGVAELVEHLARGDRGEPGWGLLVIEFRVHAARDPELTARYGVVHSRTLAALASAIAAAAARSGARLRFAPDRTAEIALALAAGMTLEQAVDPAAMGGEHADEVLTQLLADRADTGRAGR